MISVSEWLIFYLKFNTIMKIKKGGQILISILLRFAIVAHVDFGTFSGSDMRPAFSLPILNPFFFWSTVSGKFQTYQTVPVLMSASVVSGYRARLEIQGSWVQTRLRSIDFLST